MAFPVSLAHRNRGLQQADTDTLDSDSAVDSSAYHGSLGSKGSGPLLLHRIQNEKSILAVVVSNSNIYAGTQGGEILVWSLATYELLVSINAHRGSVLCLLLSSDGGLLFSSAGDAIVNVWCTKTLKRLYSLFSTYDVGDIFCVAYSSSLQTLYLGAQNTSIQWYDISEKDARPTPNLNSHPLQRNHRFFDSKGPGGITTPRPESASRSCTLGGQDLEIDKQHILQYAHYGYVYCMLLTRGQNNYRIDEEILISGGGDGTIKLWRLGVKHKSAAISEPVSLENGDESVLALAIDGTVLYSGRAEGDVDVWDLDTRQLVRRVQAHSADVLTLAVSHGCIFTGAANGFVKKYNSKYECVTKWKAHERLILASATASFKGIDIYVTGGNDDCVAIWGIGDYIKNSRKPSKTSDEQFLDSLTKFVSYRTVSSKREYAEECRRGASWLRSLFKRFGADTEMFVTKEGGNPVVFARFKGISSGATQNQRILFYGHYDVIAAENEHKKWITDPFDTQGINGYLYGRGVSDNKGPVLAALFAVADLVAEQDLSSDIVFLIEGEEECGSRGFQETIQKNKHVIGDVDWILLANSYWIDDEFPCLTYGLRGVIHATVRVESNRPDLHSGVDGSHLMDESLKDLVMLLAALTGPNGHVNIPEFYESILPATEVEKQRFHAIAKTLLRRDPTLGDLDKLSASLQARWREPSLTIHGFRTSGPTNSTIIPHSANAALSLRLVPNQEATTTQASLCAFLESQFRTLGSSNDLTITIDHQAEPWLGDPDNQIFRTLEEAIMEVWGPIGHQRRGSVAARKPKHTKKPSTSQKAVPATSSTLTNGSDHLSQATIEQEKPSIQSTMQRPLYIREGGSIPAIRFLEKEFNAPAAHLPCGQASDAAHLDNERMRLANLYKSREIFKKVFRELPLRDGSK